MSFVRNPPRSKLVQPLINSFVCIIGSSGTERRSNGSIVKISRGWALTAGAVALLSAEAASASSMPNGAPAVDPLVSVSVLGTPQSRAAICGLNGTGHNCALPRTAAWTTAAATTAAQPDPSPPKSVTWPLLVGLAVIILVAVLILSTNGDGDGNLTPISPA